MVDALNWMYGARPGEAGREVRDCHREVWGDLRGCLEEFSQAEVLVPSEAARALLRHRAGYGLEDATLRPFQMELLSLPAEAW